MMRSRANPIAAFILFFSGTSVYFLALISTERAFAVLRLIRHRITNSRVYNCSIVIVWAVGLVCFGLTVLSFHYSDFVGEYVFLPFRIFLLISFLIICVSYLSIRNTRVFCQRCFTPLVFWLVDAIYLVNSMVNPLVYSFRMQIFKDALHKFWRKTRQNVRPVGQNSLGFALEGSFTPKLSTTI